MLDQYSGECIVSKININYGIKEPTHESQKLYYQLNIGIWWVSQGANLSIPWLLLGSTPFRTLLILGLILPRYEDSCVVYIHKWYQKQMYPQIPYRTGFKFCETLIVDIQMVSKKDNTESISAE